MESTHPISNNLSTRASVLTKPDLSARLALALFCLLVIATYFIYSNNATTTPPGVLSDNVWNLSDALRISRGIPYPWVLGFRAAVVGRGDDPEVLYRFLLGGWFKLTGADVLQALILQAFINLLTIALTYHSALMLLNNRPWRRLGSLFAAATAASCMLLMFFAHKPERPILVPLVVLGAFLALLSASRFGKRQPWFLGGFLAACGVHTYTAGLVAPVWAAGFVGYQFVIGLIERKARLRPGNLFWMALGAVPPMLVWGALLLYIPDLYFRVGSVSGNTPLVVRALQGLVETFSTYFWHGNDWWAINFNASGAPMFPLVPTLLALVGIGLTIWRWRRPESFLLIGGLLIFSLPSALSIEPETPFRLIGAVPLIALLAGSGLSFLLEWVAPLTPNPFPPRKRRERGSSILFDWHPQIVLVGVSLLAMPVMLTGTYSTFQGIFANPAAHPEVRVEELYNKYFIQSVKWLSSVDQPTYVPLWILDNPISAFFLQKQAYPNVTTWSRYGLKELPPGQYFEPDRWYGTKITQDDSRLRAVLLPQTKTIVILPTSGLPADIAGPPPLGGTNAQATIHVSAVSAVNVSRVTGQIREVDDAEGQVIGYVEAVSANGFSPPPPTVEAGERAPAFGDGLRLLLREPTPAITAGKVLTVNLEWLVTTPQPADDFSTLQVIEPNFFAAYGSSDHAILPFLYPSAMWQPGDIIPDEHSITIPQDISNGVYRWGIGMYVPPRGSRFEVKVPDDFSYPQLHDLWIEHAVRLDPPPLVTTVPASAIPVHASIGDNLTLEGYNAVQGQKSISVTVYWRVKAIPTGDYTIFIHAEQDGKLVESKDEQPFGGQFPTAAWRPGEVVATTHTVALPPDLSRPITLLAGMYDYPSFQRLPVVQDGTTRPDGRAVLGLLNRPLQTTRTF